MRIVNPDVKRDLESRNPLKLELGSGGEGRKGFYAVDHLELDGVDIVADLNKPLDLLPDESVDYIYSRHTFEHIHEFLPLMRELYRVIKKNGTIEIIVPHFSNVYGYSDPTHVRLFGLYSMYYFVSSEYQPDKRKVPAFYTDIRFIIKSIKIEFYKLGMIDRILAPLFTKIVNRDLFMQDFYERRLSSFFHAWQIRFIMKADK